jgi:hypothetical protein
MTRSRNPVSSVPRGRFERLAHLGGLADRVAGGMPAEGMRQAAVDTTSRQHTEHGGGSQHITTQEHPHTGSSFMISSHTFSGHFMLRWIKPVPEKIL